MKTTHLDSSRLIAAIVTSTFGFTLPSQAELITTIPDLPPLGGVYLGPDVHAIFGGPALQFILSLPEQRPIANEHKTEQGPDEIETFFSTLDGNLEVLVNGVSQGVSPFQSSGLVTTIVFNKVGNTTGTFNTEMLSLNLSGGTLPPGVMIRESPTLSSLGQTSITDIGGGLYQIDSFFDVFTELSIDGGQTWMPTTSGPGHVELFGSPESVPDSTTTLGLLGIGLVSLAGFARCRRE